MNTLIILISYSKNLWRHFETKLGKNNMPFSRVRVYLWELSSLNCIYKEEIVYFLNISTSVRKDLSIFCKKKEKWGHLSIYFDGSHLLALNAIISCLFYSIFLFEKCFFGSKKWYSGGDMIIWKRYDDIEHQIWAIDIFYSNLTLLIYETVSHSQTASPPIHLILVNPKGFPTAPMNLHLCLTWCNFFSIFEPKMYPKDLFLRN